MVDSIQKCCRICLDLESQHISILEDNTVRFQMKCYLDIDVSPNDELPKTVCISCVSQLSKFYNFLMTARCSQDWLESSLQKNKKPPEKTPIQPLPDPEYNSDSLLEFLNSTANIEEYLNNLGKEDIPSIDMLVKNQDNPVEAAKLTNIKKTTSPNKKETGNKKYHKINMDVDVLDSELDIVKDILLKESEPKKPQTKLDQGYACLAFNCLEKFDSFEKLSQHQSTCDYASRSCTQCNILFDSKLKMQQHTLTHDLSAPIYCNCGKHFTSKEKLIKHHKVCHMDHAESMNYVYRCKKCNKVFKERLQLYKHARQHVLKEDERICDICGHIFNGDDMLTTHRKKVHKVDSSTHRCKVCQYTTTHRKKIYRHVQSHIAKAYKQELEGKHLCESCGKSFATHATLMRHSLLHQDNGNWCNICNTNFSDAKTRDIHILEHTEVTVCEKCGQKLNIYKLDAHCCV